MLLPTHAHALCGFDDQCAIQLHVGLANNWKCD